MKILTLNNSLAIMKQIFSILGAILLVVGCAKQEIKPAEEPQNVSSGKGGVSFVAGFETKVTTDAGVSTWNAGDNISVFSVANGADAGASVGTNLAYTTFNEGANASFTAVDGEVPASDKYYAYYPASPKYPSKLNAATDIGFAGVAANADVVDYRFMPVTVNSGATFVFDPSSGDSRSTNTSPVFYASANAPAHEEDPVALTFHPVLPLLELDLYGRGTLKQVVVAFSDPSTDVFAQNNWLSAKGVLDLSTGVMTVTNQSASAYYKLIVTLKEEDRDYIELREHEPMKVKLVVGHFNVTKGLTLTFTDKDGKTFSKNIWTDKTVSSYSSDGKVKHIRQGINVPYLTLSPDTVEEFPAEGGTSATVIINTNSVWGLKSKPEWVSVNLPGGTDGDRLTFTAEANSGSARSGLVVFETPEGCECSIAISQAAFQAASADYYSVNMADIDFSASYIYDVKNANDVLIARITKEYLGATKDVQIVAAYKTPSGTPDYTAGLVIDNGGSVNAFTLDPDAVTYTAGSSSAISTIWVKNDGSEILTAQPSGSVSAAAVSPYVLISPSGESNAIVKVGSQIWVTDGYKSTKSTAGSTYTIMTDTFGTKTTPAVIVNGGKYLFNAYAASADDFAPEGWSLPSETQWVNGFCAFVGTYSNVEKSYLFDRTTWKLNGTALADLTYYNTWSNTANGTKWYMLMWKNGASPVKNGQNMTAMFEVRLIKK